MNTTKLMSAALGLAIAFGAAAAMTTASAVIAPTEAAAKGFGKSGIGGFKMGGRTNNGQLGRVAVRQPVRSIVEERRPVKELKGGNLAREGAKRELARERVIDGGAKLDLIKKKKLGEKRIVGRGRV